MFVLIAIAGVFAFLMLLLVVVVFAWYSLSGEVQVADWQSELPQFLARQDRL